MIYESIDGKGYFLSPTGEIEDYAAAWNWMDEMVYWLLVYCVQRFVRGKR